MVDGGHYPVGGASEIAYNMIPIIGNLDLFSNRNKIIREGADAVVFGTCLY